MTRVPSVLFLAPPCGLLPAVISAQILQSQFAQDDEKWRATNSRSVGHIPLSATYVLAPVHDQVFGLPAPSLRVGGLFGETALLSPRAWNGDGMAWFGGSVEWDIGYTGGVLYPAIWLVGANHALVRNRPSPPLNVWQHRIAPLAEARWSVDGWNGPLATRAEFLEVLSDLRGILCNTEWRTGPGDTSFDNAMVFPPATGVICFGSRCARSGILWPSLFRRRVTASAAIRIEICHGTPSKASFLVLGGGRSAAAVLAAARRRLVPAPAAWTDTQGIRSGTTRKGSACRLPFRAGRRRGRPTPFAGSPATEVSLERGRALAIRLAGPDRRASDVGRSSRRTASIGDAARMRWPREPGAAEATFARRICCRAARREASAGRPAVFPSVHRRARRLALPLGENGQHGALTRPPRRATIRTASPGGGETAAEFARLPLLRPDMRFRGLLIPLVLLPIRARCQDISQPSLAAGRARQAIAIDGRLDEEDWKRAEASDRFLQTEPVEGAEPSMRTLVRVLADERAVYFGIRCEDPDPSAIVAHEVARDASLSGDDHVKIVLDPNRDGRTGYVFAVNPRGARYDALVARRGEGENRDWDGPFEAAASIDSGGWSAELRLPVSMLSFAEGADVWNANFERHVQRALEDCRWANPRRDQRVTNLAVTGRITGLPRFDLGRGLVLRPAVTGRLVRSDAASPEDLEAEPSADLIYRFTPEWTGVLTWNTDFSETEADQRRTNLTRFPLFFPEKRSFFLEGADAFDFGLGLGRDLVPFHSRRIGLVDGEEVPLRFGGKVIGKTGGTSFGAIAVDTGNEPGVASEAGMGVVRLRQDVLAQSNVGLIASVGDPRGRSGSWMAGADATYQTSEMFGGRNLLVGAWGLTMDREDVPGTASAYGVRVDFPNDDWDLNADYKRIDEDFDPSLGFVQRLGVQRWHFGIDHSFRPENGWLREESFESGCTIVTDLGGSWQSWYLFTSPIHARFESGDEFEFNLFPQGERLDEDFEIGDGVVLPGGHYGFLRYRLQVTGAEKRPVAGEVSWTFGDFYDGKMDQVDLSLRLVLADWLTVRGQADLVRGCFPEGRLAEDVYGVKISGTFSADLTFDSFLQYDTESDSLGANTRLRWDFSPVSQLFVVWNHGVLDPGGAFRSDGYEAAVKLQHELRF
ncbi:MAG: hypothetical protein Fur0037_07470 [Planctomycetota bacterium]